MASFNVDDFDEIEEMLLRQEKTAKETAPKMLKAGAKVLVKAQKAELRNMRKKDRSIGTLADSIGETEVKNYDNASVIYVHPQGKQPHGTPKKGQKGLVTNAQVGFVLEYGRSDMDAHPWMSVANAKSEDAVHDAMREVWEKEMGDD